MVMKLTCVTATFNCIKSGNLDRLIRCVESVAKLKTEHEHLIYDGASTDGTVKLLRELESKTPGFSLERISPVGSKCVKVDRTRKDGFCGRRSFAANAVIA